MAFLTIWQSILKIWVSMLKAVQRAWFHFPLNEEEIAERIGLNSNYEEYAIHDTENFPCHVNEYTSIEELNRLYEMIQDFPRGNFKTNWTTSFPILKVWKNWQTT